MAIESITLPRTNLRRGTSITEAVVATILLSTAAVGVGRMVFQSNGGIRAMEQRRGILRELENARAIIGSWPPDEVTEDRIEQLPFSSNVDGFEKSFAWKATVRAIDEPVSALQVNLGIQVTWNQQTGTPNQLTFWIPRPQVDEANGSDVSGADAELAEPITTADDTQSAKGDT